MVHQTVHETAKVVGDAVSIGIVGATIIQWLPAIAALVSIVWGCIRIYETKTVQGWLHKRKGKKHDTKSSS